MGARLTVGVDKGGDIFAIQQGGRAALPLETFSGLVQSARRIGLKLLADQDKLLAAEEQRRTEAVRHLYD